MMRFQKVRSNSYEVDFVHDSQEATIGTDVHLNSGGNGAKFFLAKSSAPARRMFCEKESSK